LDDAPVVGSSRVESRGVWHEEFRRKWRARVVLAHGVLFKISIP
jgi:hypothetical protein